MGPLCPRWRSRSREGSEQHCDAVVLGGLAIVGYYGRVQLGARLEASISHLQPEAVQGLGQGGDPLVVLVLFRCPDGRYCSGQFTVTASETDQQVRVSDVTSRDFVASTAPVFEP